MAKKDIKQIHKTKPVAQIKKQSFLDKKILIYLFLIICLVVAVYSNSIKNDFANWDDDEQINKNSEIKSLTTASVTKLFTNLKGTVGMYQPLTSLSFAVEYKYFELNATPYHIDNLILHILDIILVFFFIYLLTKKINIAGIAALIFGIHPMHVESVAWITERKDVLYSFFFLSGLITYIYYLKGHALHTRTSIDTQDSRSRTKQNVMRTFYLISTFILFILSLLSKSAAVCFPMVLLLVDYYLKAGQSSQTLASRAKEIIVKAFFFIIAIAFGIMTIYSQKSSGAIADLTPTYNLFERFFLACYAASFYILKLFIPIGLCAMHYFPQKAGGFLPSEYYLSSLFIAGIIASVFLIKPESIKKDMIFGLLFFLATIIMVLQILPVGFAICAERYTYIPYIGLSLPIIKIFVNYTENKKDKTNRMKPLFIMLLGAFTLAFSVISYSRNTVWQNGIKLFSDVIEKNPDMFHGYWIRGSAYSNKKDYKEAIADFDKTLERKPPNAAEVLNNRGNAKNNIYDYKGAFVDLNDAIKINPKLAEAYSNRGSAKDNLGDLQGAMEDYNIALSLKPDMITAYNNRGVTKGKMGKLKDAIVDFNLAIKINPFDPSAYLNRGNAKGFLKDYNGSLEDLNIAVKLGPTEAQAYFNRGITKVIMKDSAGACEDWKKSVSLGNASAQPLVSKYCK